MILIKAISKIKKPIVWTLHDMWAFCGAKHYKTDERWKVGYHNNNTSKYKSGIELNRWVWNKKKKAFNNKMHIVTPSSWLGHCVTKSKLMYIWPVSIVPNKINTEIWKPIEKHLAKQILNINTQSKIITFGATGGDKYCYKCINLLFEAILHLYTIFTSQFELCIFVQLVRKLKPNLGVILITWVNCKMRLVLGLYMLFQMFYNMF